MIVHMSCGMLADASRAKTNETVFWMIFFILSEQKLLTGS